MIHISAIPAFADNYIWMIDDGAQALIVDPGDAAPVLASLRARGLTLAGVLITHHHPDHIGGLAELAAVSAALPVYGPGGPRFPGVTRPVADGDTLELLGQTFSVMAVPGHTLDHIAWYAAGLYAVFCGDTMFSAGCGRLFEGTPEQMYGSLQRLAALPADTRVYCAHEYTLSNLLFAQAVEPDSAEIAARIAVVSAMRAAGQPSVPSTLADERRYNPYLRCTEPGPRAAALARDAASQQPVTVFATLRRWKDGFVAPAAPAP